MIITHLVQGFLQLVYLGLLLLDTVRHLGDQRFVGGMVVGCLHAQPD